MRTNKALPPLQPAPQKPELKKITNLVNKALTSTSLKEKNDLLQEMRVIWIPQNEELEAINASNNEKQRELDSYTQKRDQYQRDCETLRLNTSFFYKAQNVRDRKNEATISRLIQNTEDEISKISSLSSPNKLQEVNSLSSNPDKHLFTLLDLNLSRLEELAYAYKKRLLIVEQSQESTDLIIKEFGSVYGLLDREKELADENERLKNDEKAFIHDAFTRRRKFAQMSPSVARTIATVFTSEIQNQKFTLENYDAFNFEIPEDSNEDIDFDAVCNDPGFMTEPNHYEESEFTASDETTDKLLQTTDARDRLKVLKECIEQLENNNNRLMSEINTARQKKKKFLDTATTRVEKLIEENEQLFSRIAKEQDILDEKSQEGERIAKDVLTLIKHRSGYRQNLIEVFAQYRDLSKAHAEITRELYRDKTVLKSLLYLASATGVELLQGLQNIEKSPVNELLSTQITENAKQLEESAPPPPPAPIETPKEEQPEEISFLSFVKGGMKKSKRKSHKDRDSHSNASSSADLALAAEKALQLQQQEAEQAKKAQQKAQNQLMLNPTQAELYNSVSLAMDLGGYVIGHDKRYHAHAHFQLMKILKTFSSGTRDDLSNYEKNFHENLMKIRICANQILVKQKENIAIQTDVAHRSDEEIQAGDPQVVKTSRKR